MKEELARTKWCPMVRHVSANNEVYQTNRGEHPDAVNCIGSDCMVWKVHTHYIGGDGNKYSAQGEHGHCGLIRE
jgi:hypothetical protein